LGSNTTGKQVAHKQYGKGDLVMKYANHLVTAYLHRGASSDCGCGGRPQTCLVRYGLFADEIPRREQCNRRLLTSL
jgi:hypothetical protein